MKRALVLSACLLSSSLSLAFDHSHAQFDQVLKTFTQEGIVNYKALKKDPATLNTYLNTLENTSADKFKTWTADQKLAFWINAYNAFTLKAIIDNYPIKASFFKSAIYPKNSIRQIDGVWDKLRFNVMGRSMTLNEIEHDTIRKDFKEPRIHVALVCAALGCPRLRGEAYDGSKLQAQLKDDAERFLKLPFQFRIDRDKNIIYLSSIFKWFGEDFVSKAGEDTIQAILNFISKNTSKENADYIKKATYKTEYTDYDWTLNENKGAK